MNDAVQLERLRIYLSRIMSDEEISARPRLRRQGAEKVALHMGIAVDAVAPMIDRLADHLSRQMTEAIDGISQRYSSIEDTMGSIIIRDSETGKEVFLTVSQAAELDKALNSGDETEQEALARFMTEDCSTELSSDEFDLSSSSMFNFPWKLNESHGFATCEYSGYGRNFQMKLVRVVDEHGDPVAINEAAVLRQGREFIKDA